MLVARVGGLLVLVLMLTGFTTPLVNTGSVAVVQATTAGVEPSTTNTTILQNQAVLIQKMLARLLDVVNKSSIPNDVIAKLRELVVVNVTTLSSEELTEYIREARTLLRELRTYVVSEKSIPMRKLVLERVKGIVEERVRKIANRLNLTNDELEEVLAQIRSATTLPELFRAVKSIDKKLSPSLAILFAKEARMLYKNAVRGIVEAKIKDDLHIAIRASSKVLVVLNRTLERLRGLNVSEHAIEAIERAIHHIMVARSILINVSKELGPIVKLPPEKIEERFRRIHSRVVGHLVAKIIAEIEVTLRELKLYHNILAEMLSKGMNTTIETPAPIDKLVNEIEVIINKLVEVRNKLMTGDTKAVLEAIDLIAKAKRLLGKARVIVLKVSKIDTTGIVEELYRDVVERIGELRKRIDYIESMLQQIGDARHRIRVAKIIDRAKTLLSAVETLVSDAEEAIKQENYSQAMRLLQRANAMLVSIERLLIKAESIVQQA